MTYSLWLLLSKHARALSITIYSLIGLGAVLSGYWFTRSLFTIPQIKTSQAAVKAKKAALMVASRDVQDVKTVAATGGQSLGSQIIQVTEAEVENNAHDAGCKVAQFSASPTATAYISRYGGNSAGYDMYSVKFTLNGNLSGVLATLQSLCDGPVPFEFGAMTLMPAPDVKGNGNQVSASIEIDPVTKQVAAL